MPNIWVSPAWLGDACRHSGRCVRTVPAATQERKAEILPLVAWDLVTRGHIHRATLWGGLWIVLSLPLRFAIAGTSTWLAIADGAFVGPPGAQPCQAPDRSAA